MPILNTQRGKIEVKLPQTEATVYIWDTMLAGDLSAGMDFSNTNKKVSPLDVIVSAIAEWDFTDAAGNLLPITNENAKFIPVKDFTVLMQEIEKVTKVNNLGDDVKKNTGKTSI